MTLLGGSQGPSPTGGGVSVKEKPRLGRGLDALIGGSTNGGDAPANREQMSVPVGQIQQNPFQPRKTFDDDELSPLSDSIRTHGVLQPLVVRAVGDHFQLIAGERRLRAAQAAGLAAVPVRIVDFNDQQVLEAALVENIQRADLNPIEKAHGFKDYLDRFQMTHEQLAARLGLARTTITNLVGLLDLPAEVQEAVRVGQISAGHAKLLKGIADRDAPGGDVQGDHRHGPVGAGGRGTHQGPEARAPIRVHENGAGEEPPRQGHRGRTAAETGDPRGNSPERADKGQIVLSFECNDDFERLLEALRK